MAGRQGPDDVERTERQRAQRDLAAAGDRGVDASLAEVAERLAEGDRARRAGVGGRQDRTADAQGDPEVGRRRPAEHGQGEVRRDGPDAALEVALVLALGVGDAAERGPEVDPDPFGGRGAVGAGRRSAASSRASRPATRPNWLNRSSWRAVFGRHPGERVEVVDLGGDLRAERARVEPVDAPDGRAARPQAGPERVAAGADRGDERRSR